VVLGISDDGENFIEWGLLGKLTTYSQEFPLIPTREKTLGDFGARRISL
jgi:hypothetical protein